MKKYHIEFYSNNGYLLGESVNEYEDILEVERYTENLIKTHTAIKITSNTENGVTQVEFLKVDQIAKVVVTEQR